MVEVRGFLKDKRLLTGHGESKDGLQGLKNYGKSQQILLV